MKKVTKLNEVASAKFAILLAQNVASGIVFLQGNLGAGKTFLVRNWLYALGFEGKVKSPTFTLVEPYTINNTHVYHCDLYRFIDPQELEFLGIRDYLISSNLCLIEWAENGVGFLPSPDLLINIEIMHNLRNYILSATSDYGLQLLTKINL